MSFIIISNVGIKRVDCICLFQERILEDLQRAKREVDTLRQQIEHLARYCKEE